MTGGDPSGWRVDVVPSIDSIDRDEWDALAAGRSVYSCWRWHRALETTHAWTPRYLLARAPEGPAAAALPAFFADAPFNPLYDPSTILADLPPPGPGWYPGVVAGSRAGYLTELLVPPGARRQVLRLLCDAFLGLAEERRAAATWSMYAGAEDALDFAEAIGPRAVVLLVGGDSEIEIEWPDFDGYLQHLSSARRRAVRREIDRFEESGASLPVEPLTGLERDLAPLLAAVDDKHGHRTSLDEAERYLKAHAQSLGEVARVFVCRRGGTATGFALFYEWSGRLWARAVGSDYRASERGDYFNTLFYGPIRWAIARGLRSVHFGVDAFEAKLARGCGFRPLWGVVAGRHRAAGAEVERARRRNTVALGDLEARYGRLMRRGFPRATVELMDAAGWVAPS